MDGRASYAMLVMMAVVVVAALAQTQTQSESNQGISGLPVADTEVTNDVEPTGGSTGSCLKKCGLKCGFRLIRPPTFPICFVPCMAACKFSPSQALTSCTANCAHSMLLSHKPDSEINMEDGEKIGGFVESCFQSCQGN